MQAKLDTVKKHMSGKRFEAAKGALLTCKGAIHIVTVAIEKIMCATAEFTLDQRELMEEPELENSEDVSMSADMH